MTPPNNLIQHYDVAIKLRVEFSSVWDSMYKIAMCWSSRDCVLRQPRIWVWEARTRWGRDNNLLSNIKEYFIYTNIHF